MREAVSRVRTSTRASISLICQRFRSLAVTSSKGDRQAGRSVISSRMP